MGFFSDHKEKREEVFNAPDGEENMEHKRSWGVDLVSGAAGFEAMKKWEDHQRAEGNPVQHAAAKEALAGFAAAEVADLISTKGLDFWDKEKKEHAEEKARKQARELYEEHYGADDQGEWHPGLDRHEALNY